MLFVNLPQGRINYAERGAGHPLVFVHGYLMDGGLWDRLAETPELQGFRCIMPTWPLGAHTEPMDPAADLSPPGLAAMIAGFITALELKHALRDRQRLGHRAVPARRRPPSRGDRRRRADQR